jgi:hypothetical protein
VHLAPEKARELIREGAKRALTRARTETFGVLAAKPPYEAVVIMRSDGTAPARIGRKRHETSVIELLNFPWTYEPIEFDPAQVLAGAGSR